MENKENIDNKLNMEDIILDGGDEPSGNNIKKILTIIAILVVLFLFVLIVMKFINSGSEIEEDKSLIMPSEKLLDDKTNKLFEETQIQKDKEAKPSPEQKIEPASKTEATPSLPQTEISKPESSKEVMPEKKETQDKKAEVKKEQKSEHVTKTAEIKKTEPKKHEEKNSQKVKKVTKKVSPKELFKNIKTPSKTAKGFTKTLKSGHYVQVLAASKFQPDNTTIKKLVAKKYKYVLFKTTIKNKEFIKVLVGPLNATKAKEVLKNIKEGVSKDAFIFVKK